MHTCMYLHSYVDRWVFLIVLVYKLQVFEEVIDILDPEMNLEDSEMDEESYGDQEEYEEQPEPPPQPPQIRADSAMSNKTE